MPTTINATFDVTGWDETAYDEPAEGPKLSRVTVTKRFTGTLEATSTAQLLTSVAQDDPNQAGYIGSERVTGALEGRGGTFVLQHSGTMTRGTPQLIITVVPDSGTGELAGLSGTMTIDIVDGKHFYKFDYSLAKFN